MDAYNPEQSSSARKWLLSIAGLVPGNALFDAMESALFHLELYEAERATAGEISAARTELLGQSSPANRHSLDEIRRTLFAALARQINAQENLRLALEGLREVSAKEVLPFEAEMFMAWIESQAESARDAVQMHQLLREHSGSA